MKNGVFWSQIKAKFGDPRGVSVKQQNLRGTPLSIVSCLLWAICVTIVEVLALTEQPYFIR